MPSRSGLETLFLGFVVVAICVALVLLTYLKQEWAPTLLQAIATLTTIAVAYRAIAGEGPLLKIADVVLSDWSMNDPVFVYVRISVLNLSRRSNAIVSVELQQRATNDWTSDQMLINYKRSRVDSATATTTTYLSEGTLSSTVQFPPIRHPITIPGDSAIAIDGGFFRKQKAESQYVELKPQDFKVRLRDANGRTYEFTGAHAAGDL